MSTTAIMSNHHRRFATPLGVGPSNKRKEREGCDIPKPPAKKLARPSIPKPGSPSSARKPPTPAPANQFLAGYLAHEFLTKGTLFGKLWGPAPAGSGHVSAEPRGLKSSSSSQKAKAETSSRAEPLVEKNQRYVEVTHLLKTDGAHLPGIVNPTQLARFLQL